MKILLADPHPEVQSALRLVLERTPGVSQVGGASSLVQLLGQCAKAQACPDMVFFDLDLLQPSHGEAWPLADLIALLRRLCPHAMLVAMSSRFGAQAETLTAGANGFISKTDPPDLVLASILQFVALFSSDPSISKGE